MPLSPSSIHATALRAETYAPRTYDPTALAEEPSTAPTAFSSTESSQSHEHETSHSGSFEWQESVAPTLAPTTAAPTTAPAPLPTTPKVTAVAVPSSNKSAGGSRTAVVSVTLVIVSLLVALGLFLFLRRRRRNNRFISAKFHHDPNLGTPTVSIELPPPPPSSRLSASQNNQQRLSVFSNGRAGGASIFNTTAPVVSPRNNRLQGTQASGFRPDQSTTYRPDQSSTYRPDQSTTYRLFDPTPTNVPTTPILQSTDPSTPVMGTPTRPQHQPDYGHYKPQYETTKTSATAGDKTMTTSATTVSSSFQSQPNGAGRDTTVSVASTIQGFHDSMCDDLYQYGDGLGRERARSRSRGNSSATSSTRPKKPSIVLEIDELMPLPTVPTSAPAYSTPKTSKKTLSFAEMRAGGAKRAPPPPPPAAPSSFFPAQPVSPTMSETEPFNPLMMTSVRVHAARASEDPAGNRATVVATFSSSASSAAASAGSASFESDSSLTSALSASSSGANMVSSHNGRIFSTPTDTAIQRLSDVSSVSSETSTVRPGSLIELKQVLEVENLDGKAKEIEI